MASRMARERLDKLLVDRGLVASRERARALIMAGDVLVGGHPETKPGTQFDPDVEITLRGEDHPYVSRGALKLVKGLDTFQIDPTGMTCLDIGASTGGFTQVLLARGAALVIAVDVGQGQLHATLASDPRVVSLEKMDARTLTRDAIERAARAAGVDADAPMLITCDVSFIGLEKILPPVLSLATPGSELVALIKPQFEAGVGRRKQGVVKDPAVHQQIGDRVAKLIESFGWKVIGIEASPILGGEGNREFLIGARRA
jgi:23S rRNA (cytidine1920-2'-O)/16S rRNA (cytidine1409-2'-O)-methyltransferase